MNRRDALKTVALLMAGTLTPITQSVLLGNNLNAIETGNGRLFTADERIIVKRITDIIIPKTDIPGTVEAGVPEFVIMMLQDCYPKKVQNEFHLGLDNFNAFCLDNFKNDFLKLDNEQQEMTVVKLDKEVLEGTIVHKKDLSFYRILKELTLFGYFTSEPGATQALRYVMTPGDFDGCADYEKGDRAWSDDASGAAISR